jgi:hypothetical protein
LRIPERDIEDRVDFQRGSCVEPRFWFVEKFRREKMKRFIVMAAAALMVVSALAEASQAQLFRGRRAHCGPAAASACCPAPAPVCCPAPAPVCCPAPAPVCCPAPAPTCCETACNTGCDPCGRRIARRTRHSTCCGSAVVPASCTTGCCGTSGVVYGGGMVSGCPTCSTTVDSGQIIEESSAPSVAPPAPVPDAGT